MSDDLFAESNNRDPGDSQETNAVDQLVGEGKKYSSIEKLAESKLHGDQFIEQLKGELAETRSQLEGTRSQLATQAKLEEVLDRLNSRQGLEEDDNEPNHGDYNQSGQTAISTKEIETLIEQKVTQKELDRTARQNREKAIESLKEIFGDDYGKRLEEKRQELGLDKETLNSLAARSPKAFIELVQPKENKESRPFAPPASGVRTESMNYNKATPVPGTHEYYKHLKATNPSLYRSPQVQAQLHKDAIKAVNEGKDFDFSNL